MNFAETRKNMREKVKASLGFTAEERSSEGGDAKPEKMDEVIAEAEKMTEEEAKAAQDDSSLLVILHYARRRFLERGLVGSIDVSSL